MKSADNTKAILFINFNILHTQCYLPVAKIINLSFIYYPVGHLQRNGGVSFAETDKRGEVKKWMNLIIKTIKNLRISEIIYYKSLMLEMKALRSHVVLDQCHSAGRLQSRNPNPGV